MKKKAQKQNTDTSCPCGGEDFGRCCGRFLEGKEEAPNALLLMRSRYTAYVLQDKAYLQHTWSVKTVPDDINQLFTPPFPKWLGLSIKDYQINNTDQAEVEFIARYKVGGKAYHLHERSYFLYLQDRWVYIDGKIGSI